MTSREKAFRRIVWGHYRKNGRDLPWRRTRDPYRILVSEFMLQQTQVARVLVFYPRFLKQFPSFRTLARAPLRDVLRAWQGLGYNRRALYLHRTAKMIAQEHRGKIPRNFDILQTLPGIGQSTAGALMAFAFGKSVPFIETNIRRAYLHQFFPRKRGVNDKTLSTIAERTLDCKRPREWYYALMDYGAVLGARDMNPNQKSAHYHRQSSFRGSNRELRGQVVRLLTRHKTVSRRILELSLPKHRARLRGVLRELTQEGFITQRKAQILISP